MDPDGSEVDLGPTCYDRVVVRAPQVFGASRRRLCLVDRLAGLGETGGSVRRGVEVRQRSVNCSNNFVRSVFRLVAFGLLFRNWLLPLGGAVTCTLGPRVKNRNALRGGEMS